MTASRSLLLWRGFPWTSHLTIAESDLVQGLRVRYEDGHIHRMHRVLCPMIELPRVLGFLRRNPRPERIVA